MCDTVPSWKHILLLIKVDWLVLENVNIDIWTLADITLIILIILSNILIAKYNFTLHVRNCMYVIFSFIHCIDFPLLFLRRLDFGAWRSKKCKICNIEYYGWSLGTVFFVGLTYKSTNSFWHVMSSYLYRQLSTIETHISTKLYVSERKYSSFIQ